MCFLISFKIRSIVSRLADDLILKCLVSVSRIVDNLSQVIEPEHENARSSNAQPLVSGQSVYGTGNCLAVNSGQIFGSRLNTDVNLQADH